MTRILKLSALLALGLILSCSFAGLSARIPYARETGKKCVFCHSTTLPSVSDLNWAGQYYAERRTLIGYVPEGAVEQKIAETQEETNLPPKKASAKEVPEAKPTTTEIPRAVVMIYNSKCAMCHGTRGQGIAALKTADFTTEAWQKSRSNAEIQDAIANGRKPAMPGYARTLDEKVIRNLVDMIRGFGSTGGPEEKKSP